MDEFASGRRLAAARVARGFERVLPLRRQVRRVAQARGDHGTQLSVTPRGQAAPVFGAALLGFSATVGFFDGHESRGAS